MSVLHNLKERIVRFSNSYIFYKEHYEKTTYDNNQKKVYDSLESIDKNINLLNLNMEKNFNKINKKINNNILDSELKPITQNIIKNSDKITEIINKNEIPEELILLLQKQKEEYEKLLQILEKLN